MSNVIISSRLSTKIFCVLDRIKDKNNLILLEALTDDVLDNLIIKNIHVVNCTNFTALRR